MARGDTIERPVGDDGVPMIEGDPDEPQGPEDAAGLGPTRGDYSSRLGEDPLKVHQQYRRDADGNVVTHDQTAKILEGDQAAPTAGQKGGVDNAEDTSPDLEDEVQTITVDATGGTYTLIFDGEETAGVGPGVLPATLETALEALANVADGDLVVSGSAGNYVVSFQSTGAYGGVNVPQLKVGDNSLTGGASTVVIETTEQGS